MKQEILKGFIVIEGLDGSGTTTQLDNITSFLRNRNISHIRTFEPTDRETGLLIRKVLAGQIPLKQETIAYLFAADRNEHIFGEKNGIIELLKTNRYVISDRYHFSSIAYQSINSDPLLVEELNSRFPLPEFLIFVDVPVEECQRRINMRNGAVEIYDNIDYQRIVLENYNKAIGLFAESQMKVIRVNGTKSAEEVTGEIISAVFSD
ncbi:MAG: dTMP kinase [Spirochaetales bacterium]|nr:dTMP kinase [Spirochaetales bacterium]